MKVHIFVQERLNSRRLPGKALLKILGKTMFEHIVERLKHVKGAEKVVLVTGPKEQNLELVEEAERLGVDCFCGSEENLLDRFYQAGKQFQPDAIVRVTGDNPFIDPRLVDKAIERFSRGDCDILFLFKGYPLGIGIDIFSREVLEKAWEMFLAAPAGAAEAILLLPGIKRQDIACEKDFSRCRLTVDYPEDFEQAKKVYEALYPKNPVFSLEDILAFLGEV